MKQLCTLFGKSKQAYYQHDEDLVLQHAAMRSFAIEYAKEIRAKDPGMGMMKIWYMYNERFKGAESTIGRDAFCDLLIEEGMKVRLKVRKPKTTDSTHGLPTYPNLIKDFIPNAPNQLWVSDITYIMLYLDEEHYKFCYLSLIMDAYTKEIVGWSVGDSLKTEYALGALQMALRRKEGKAVSLIHHSDRGVQYASSEYVKTLLKADIKISMTESGDPKDNAQAERINNTMKNELLKSMRFKCIDEVVDAVTKAVLFYNNERPHMSLEMNTPSQVASMKGKQRRLWRSYREEAIERNINLDKCIGNP